jgi:hypothetical protein
VAAGSTSPIKPLDSTASASSAQAPSSQRRLSIGVGWSRWARHRANTAAASKKLTPMSSVLTWPITFHSTLPASTAPAIIPAWAAEQACGGEGRQQHAEEAGQRRPEPCGPVVFAKGVKAVAVAQYCSGGFSKYLMPLRRGVSQSPLATISRGISA